MIYLYNDQDVSNSQFTISNGSSFPSNWCLLSTLSDLQNMGIICLNEIYPILGMSQSFDGTYVDLNNEYRIYNIVTNIFPSLDGTQSYSGFSTSIVAETDLLSGLTYSDTINTYY